MLVNNAGTTIPKKFEAATLEELDRLIDSRRFHRNAGCVKQMKDGGRIITIGRVRT